MSNYFPKLIKRNTKIYMRDFQINKFRFINEELLPLEGCDKLCYVYKFLRIEYLLNMIQNASLYLMHIGKWEDPYELLYFKQKNFTLTPEMESIQGQLFGQSWTFRSESDALWRIYSPDKQGVRICTSVQRLYNVLNNANINNPDIDFYLGAVQYESRRDVHKWLKTKKIKDNAGEIIQSLFYKRENFQHENEFRIIVRFLNSNQKQEGITIPINDLSFIYSIEFDPRIDDLHFNVWSECVRKLLPKVKIHKSKLYEIKNI